MKLKTKLGEVHQKLLDRLSKGDWVNSKDLFELTGQTYFDRRIRELRDEEGWQIEYERRGSDHGYKLVSFKRGKKRKRHYLSTREKREIFERDDYTCQICGERLLESEAQVDHRIPLIKDGPLEKSNLQTLCSECNVKKRRICKNCEKPSCEDCFWAYPSLMENRIVLQIPPKLYKDLEEKSKSSGKDLSEFIIGLLSKV